VVGEGVDAVQEVEFVALAAFECVYDIHVAVVGRIDVVGGEVEVFAFVEDQILVGEAVAFEYRLHRFFDFGFFVEMDEIITGANLQVVFHEVELVLGSGCLLEPK